MDNFDVSDFNAPDLDEPIHLDEPIPFDEIAPSESGVSHAPLDLSGSSVTPAPKAPAPKPVTKPGAPEPVGTKPTETVVSGDRIVGVKTFFTKLHAGAITFLEEQIARWLKTNPDVVIKRTNVVTGDVQGKKTEPNIIITIWY